MRMKEVEDLFHLKFTSLCFYCIVFYFLIKEFRKITYLGFLDGAVVKNLPANAGDTRDMGLIPGLRRSPGTGNSNPLQYSYLENSMDRGSWWATVHTVTRSRTWLSAHIHTHTPTHPDHPKQDIGKFPCSTKFHPAASCIKTL